MDRFSFGALVARLDDYARRSPAKYQSRVVLLGLLGYAYIFTAAGLTKIADSLIYSRE